MRTRISHASARFRTGVALTLCVVGVAGCDHLLRVQDPDVASPGSVSGADKLPTQLGASIGTFQVGFGGDGSGGNEGLVNMTGLFTDEFSFAETFPTRRVVDNRSTTNNNSSLLTIFFNIQQARAIAASASDAYNQFDPSNADHSQVLSNEAYSQLLMAEMYCGAVPFSKQNADGSQSNSTPLTTPQMLQTAIATFDSAISIADSAGDGNRDGLARVGKARALMDLGGANIAIADTVVTNVPTTFVSQVLHSENTSRENNGVNELVFSEHRWTVGDSEGINGLPFVSAHDPRVGTVHVGIGFDHATPVFGPLKDSTRSSPETLASGVEARLINAEAALDAGNTALWLSDLNDLRANATSLGVDSTLAPLADPGAANNARLLLTMRERAFWLFASAHRLGDMRRLTRAVADGGYGLDVNSVYPVGTWHNTAGQTYGSDVNFPIPLEEGNNPNFNAAQCDVTLP
ncbi:MAG TPA: hypothetical protein VJR24_18380 [Gemmatimonadaceae bacterium]|nr:hypothetical protein [Gemmatimonadaceae bacterium]